MTTEAVRGRLGRAPRVAYVISSSGMGGAEKLFTALIAGGVDRGWEQLVLNPFANERAAESLAREYAPAQYIAKNARRLVDVWPLRTWLSERLASFRPDIVHVSLFHAAALMAAVPHRGERRLLTHVYGEGIRQLSYPTMRRFIDRWASRRFDHVSAISSSVRAYLERDCALSGDRVGQIALGWNGTPVPRRSSVNRPATIVCVAVLRREKGHDTLLAAFDRVRRDIPDARLVLVGDGPYRPQIEAMVKRRGLENNVEMAGRVPNIWERLADADVFALASPSEAFGIAILEAMAAGLPVVASRTGGIPELVAEGRNGELFTPGNDAELAEKLTSLLRDPERLRRMSNGALTFAATMHMDRATDRYFDLYNELL